MKLKVELPLLVTGKHMQLAVSEDCVQMRNGKYYELAIRLPFAVDSKSARTAFSTTKRHLIIKLKVINIHICNDFP